MSVTTGAQRRTEGSPMRGSLMAIPLLILFTEGLDVRLAVRIEEFLAAQLPRRFEFGRRDVPVRPAFLEDRTQVLAEFFQSGPSEEPIAHVDLINDELGLEDDDVGDHGIVERVGVFGNVEIFLDGTPHVREERPVGADAGAILIRLGDVVVVKRNQPAIANLQLTMECNKPFSLPAVLGAEASATEDEDHRMLSLQFGELPAFRGVVRKLVIGEGSPWNNVRSHMKSLTVGYASPGCISMVSSLRPHSGRAKMCIRNTHVKSRYARD